MLGIKKNEIIAATSASTKETNIDANIRKQNQGQKKEGGGFSLFGKKEKIEDLKKKAGSQINPPITANSKTLEEHQSRIIERYAVREPVVYISIARDEIGSLIYLIEEPNLTPDEIIVYSQLMEILQYELKAPYDSTKTDPKEYFDEQAKKELGITLDRHGNAQDVMIYD